MIKKLILPLILVSFCFTIQAQDTYKLKLDSAYTLTVKQAKTYHSYSPDKIENLCDSFASSKYIYLITDAVPHTSCLLRKELSLYLDKDYIFLDSSLVKYNIIFLFLNETKLETGNSLTKLEKLLFFSNSNYLDTLPSFVYNSPNILGLNIVLKNEHSIKDTFINISNLERVIIEFDEIKNVPPTFKQAYSLKEFVIMSKNRKACLFPKFITQLKSLETLELPIELTRDNIELLENLPQLEYLTVKTYKSEDIESLKKLSHLKMLRIRQIKPKNLKKIRAILPLVQVESGR